jgi:SAM-dependent methyltransferase
MIHELKDYIRFGSQLATGWRTKHERWIADLRRSDLSPYLNEQRHVTILDLANGQLRPQYKILQNDGQLVYGIDIVNRPKRGWRDYAFTMARALYTRGLHPGDSVFDDTLVCGDVSMLPFRDESFDLITSVAAFEHFLDVPKVLKETCRVVRSGGLVWGLVHLFSSPSGGHNVSLSEVPLRTIPSGVDPWDHLRRRRLPFHVPLNEWRKHQYLAEFQKYFEVLKHYCAIREGEHFLTAEIENELADYTRDELTCGAYVIVGRKPASTSF